MSQEPVVKDNSIKLSAILKLGKDNALIIKNAYASNNAEKKLAAIDNIKNSSMTDETKLKFIGDIITRPKGERIKISSSLGHLINKML